LPFTSLNLLSASCVACITFFPGAQLSETISGTLWLIYAIHSFSSIQWFEHFAYGGQFLEAWIVFLGVLFFSFDFKAEEEHAEALDAVVA